MPSPDQNFLAETASYEVHEFTSLIKDPGGEGGTRQEIAHLKDEPGSNVTFKTETGDCRLRNPTTELFLTAKGVAD